jgi:hypothetical protein
MSLPQTPWHPNQLHHYNPKVGFPKLVPSKEAAKHDAAGTSSNAAIYAETQNEELEVLRSIYMDDFEDLNDDKTGAWNVRDI